MSHSPAFSAEVRVDTANPGQFFACCGLLELADRLWRGAEGWVAQGMFRLRPLDVAAGRDRSLADLLGRVTSIALEPSASDDLASPVYLPDPFDLHLDWWRDEQAGGKRLKVWAGTMGSVRIARAMHGALRDPRFLQADLLDQADVVYDPEDSRKKVEPFYFDARRGASALPIDVGFSPDALSMTAVAHPAVEFLCLVGLQRFRPMQVGTSRLFDYFPWAVPIDCRLASCAAVGLVPHARGSRFRFENAFRTDQRKHKAFTPATPV
jgi:CRISPR-associated protein Csx14